MKKSELKLIAALSNIDLGGHKILTLQSAVTIADNLRNRSVQEFCSWLLDADLTYRIMSEHPLEGDLRDAAVVAVAERLLELDGDLTDKEEDD